jgi:hypothetical protein
MRRATLSEPELAALRTRAIDLGLVLAVRNDSRGDCVIRIGDRTFADFARAVAHVDQLEKSEGVLR